MHNCWHGSLIVDKHSVYSTFFRYLYNYLKTTSEPNGTCHDNHLWCFFHQRQCKSFLFHYFCLKRFRRRVIHSSVPVIAQLYSATVFLDTPGNYFDIVSPSVNYYKLCNFRLFDTKKCNVFIESSLLLPIIISKLTLFAYVCSITNTE